MARTDARLYVADVGSTLELVLVGCVAFAMLILFGWALEYLIRRL